MRGSRISIRNPDRQVDRARGVPLDHPGCTALAAAGVRSLGLDWRVPASVWGEGLSPTVLLFWVASGRVALLEPRIEAGPDSCLIVPPEAPKRLTAPAGALHAAYVHLDPRGSWRPLATGGARVIPAARARHVAALLAFLADETVGTAGDAIDAPLAQSVLACCIALNAGEAPRAQAERRLFQRIWDEVAAAPARPWRAEGLARLAGMSTGHFHRRVRALHGCGPMGVVRRIRLARAADLLRTSDRDLAAIAREIGYATGFALSNALRAHLGRRPQAIRGG